MELLEVTMVNWKCYRNKTVTLHHWNVLHGRNGTGKTSLFEAVIYALYGKRPAGQDLNSLRNDTSKMASVSVSFEHDGKVHCVTRSFGKGSSVEMTVDEQVVASSSRDADLYMEKVLPWGVASVLWSPGLLTTSKVLDPSFLVDNVFEHAFHDPKALLKMYKAELLGQNKVVKRVEANLGGTTVTQEDVDAVEGEVNAMRESLRDEKHSKSVSGDVAAAKQAKAASERLKDLAERCGPNFRRLSVDACKEFKALVGDDVPPYTAKVERCKRVIEAELRKGDHFLLRINPSVARQLVDEGARVCQCPVCGGKPKDASIWSKLRSVVNGGKVNVSLVERNRRNLALLSLNPEDVALSVEWFEQEVILSRCRNWEAILDEDRIKRELAWKTLSEAEARLTEMKRRLALQEEWKVAKAELAEVSHKVEVLNEYVTQAAGYFTETVTASASDALREISGRYDMLILDGGRYMVSVLSDAGDTLSLLPAMSLSSGERTLIGAALIISVCRVFYPNIPLLFDESFAALDGENLESFKTWLQKQQHQSLVITHNLMWLDQ